MEVIPKEFDSIIRFFISNVKQYRQDFDEIKELTIEIESKIQGKNSLVLLKPYQPYNRPGEELDTLKSLHEKPEDIEFIWVFQKRDDAKKARIEIRFKGDTAPVFVKCDQVQGLPCRDKI